MGPGHIYPAIADPLKEPHRRAGKQEPTLGLGKHAYIQAPDVPVKAVGNALGERCHLARGLAVLEDAVAAGGQQQGVRVPKIDRIGVVRFGVPHLGPVRLVGGTVQPGGRQCIEISGGRTAMQVVHHHTRQHLGPGLGGRIPLIETRRGPGQNPSGGIHHHGVHRVLQAGNPVPGPGVEGPRSIADPQEHTLTGRHIQEGVLVHRVEGHIEHRHTGVARRLIHHGEHLQVRALEPLAPQEKPRCQEIPAGRSQRCPRVVDDAVNRRRHIIAVLCPLPGFQVSGLVDLPFGSHHQANTHGVDNAVDHHAVVHGEDGRVGVDRIHAHRVHILGGQRNPDSLKGYLKGLTNLIPHQAQKYQKGVH